MRWQRFMILVTLVLSTLLTSIWFYSSRGAQCCAEIRAILGCAPAGPCRGYVGDCADILAQFSDVEGPYIFSDGPGEPPTPHMYLDDYVCHAFPGARPTNAHTHCCNAYYRARVLAISSAWCCCGAQPTRAPRFSLLSQMTRT
jgi:hypothetical protein